MAWSRRGGGTSAQGRVGAADGGLTGAGRSGARAGPGWWSQLRAARGGRAVRARAESITGPLRDRELPCAKVAGQSGKPSIALSQSCSELTRDYRRATGASTLPSQSMESPRSRAPPCLLGVCTRGADRHGRPTRDRTRRRPVGRRGDGRPVDVSLTHRTPRSGVRTPDRACAARMTCRPASLPGPTRRLRRRRPPCRSFIAARDTPTDRRRDAIGGHRRSPSRRHPGAMAPPRNRHSTATRPLTSARTPRRPPRPTD